MLTDAADGYGIGPAPDRLPGLLSGPVPGKKAVKNRPHLDLPPDAQAAGAARLLAPGTRTPDAA